MVFRILKESEVIKMQPFKESFCPDCGNQLIHQDGCLFCPNCGYSKCECCACNGLGKSEEKQTIGIQKGDSYGIYTRVKL